MLRELLDAEDRRRRFEAVRAAYATADAPYRAETDAWAGVGGGVPT